MEIQSHPLQVVRRTHCPIEPFRASKPGGIVLTGRRRSDRADNRDQRALRINDVATGAYGAVGEHSPLDRGDRTSVIV